MKYILTTAVTLSIAAVLSCEPNARNKGPRTEPAADSREIVPAPAPPVEDGPLLLNDEPLLLDEDEESEPAAGADNSRCHVCHINYATEELAVTHARAGKGCASCHGPSDEHIADESWASGGNGTAPDIMYPKNKINPSCLACHRADKLPEAEHKAALTANATVVCTDCHGDHRLHTRRCNWK